VSLLCRDHHAVHLWCSPRRWPRGATNQVQIHWICSHFLPPFQGRWPLLIRRNRSLSHTNTHIKTYSLSQRHSTSPVCRSRCRALQGVAGRCSVVQCVAACCRVLQYVSACSRVLYRPLPTFVLRFASLWKPRTTLPKTIQLLPFPSLFHYYSSRDYSSSSGFVTVPRGV